MGAILNILKKIFHQGFVLFSKPIYTKQNDGTKPKIVFSSFQIDIWLGIQTACFIGITKNKILIIFIKY